MCGIVGMLEFEDGKPVSGETISAMCDAIIHRGPDDAGQHIEGRVGLGMRRLSIIDRSGGQQPIANEDKTIWIVFNGEIYNHRELRRDLQARGHVFSTEVDTETIVHLYEEYDLDCLSYLQGMFGFAIWDIRRQRLFVARDRLGIKPMFWSDYGGCLTFGSEIKSLIAAGRIPLDMDANGLDAFFAYNYIPAPLTIYKNIHKLPAAHYLLVENAQIQKRRYWDVSFADKHKGSSTEIIEEFMDIFGTGVNDRLMSEVPLGAFLSGGIDSGLVVAMMGCNSSTPPNTFTISFGGETGNFLDERSYAREIVERYGCRHQEIEVVPNIAKALSGATRAFDEPFADDGLIPTYHICEQAREHVTVVLTGLGGDENFAGYERYLGVWAGRLYQRLPGLLRNRVLAPLVASLREEKGGHYRINHLKRFVKAGNMPASHRYQDYICAMDAGHRRQLYTPELARGVDFEYVDFLGREHFERLDGGDDLDRALYQDINMYLPEDILTLSDRIGMHHSLELRVPFVDHRVVEFCARIPSKMKIRNWRKKDLLAQAARKYLPASVMSHRKQGFCSPMAIWLRGDLRELVENQLSSTNIDADGLFASSVVRELVDDHMSLRSLNDKTLFSLLVFRQWLEAWERVA